MSARISKGDTVRCTHGEPDSGLFVGRNYEAKEVYVRSATGDAYIDVGVDPDGWRAERFEKVEHAEPEDRSVCEREYDGRHYYAVDGTCQRCGHIGLLLPAEPEDKDDLYVEPEPLKEGDWVQVWARFGVVDEHVPSHVEMPMPDGRVHDGYVRPDAIVRPDAGQVPPWIKPAQCTSLVERTADSLPVLMRCEHEAGHEAKHVVGWVAWTDAEAYGRVEVSS